MNGHRSLHALLAAAVLWGGGCEGGSIDAGRDHGLLPVDERNPLILSNDSVFDNWTGEYAMLLANAGGPPLAGIIVNPSPYWPNLEKNVEGWQQLIAAARTSGLRGIPDATGSAGEPLVRPADGKIESTTPNLSEGAKMIVDLSAHLYLPGRPVVVATGSRLTELADAYLIDRAVADRVVVVSALGGPAGSGSVMGWPNGELDPWADWIVAERFRYIQVNGYYDQLGDLTTTSSAKLPANPFGSWMAAKLPSVLQIPMSSDQIGVLAVGQRGFATAVGRAAIDAAADPTQPPPLVANEAGSVLVVPACDTATAADRLWQMLLDPHTFGP